MICQTAKEGTECFFMTKKGCDFNGGACYSVVEHCEGCDRVQEFLRPGCLGGVQPPTDHHFTIVVEVYIKHPVLHPAANNW